MGTRRQFSREFKVEAVKLVKERGVWVAQAGQSVAWHRGKYLVQGLSHCAACHSTRNALGGSPLQAEFAGGLMPDGDWYAPSLASAAEAGLQGWPLGEAVRLLKSGVSTGVSTQASVSGPMAEVVYNSTQHLTQDDVQAMVLYLASIPQKQPRPVQVKPAEPGLMAQGGRLYGQHCAACHGEQGQGVSGIYPALSGNRAVNLHNPNCRVPCDHVPTRSWALFKARDVMRGLIEVLKAEQMQARQTR